MNLPVVTSSVPPKPSVPSERSSDASKAPSRSNCKMPVGILLCLDGLG